MSQTLQAEVDTLYSAMERGQDHCTFPWQAHAPSLCVLLSVHTESLSPKCSAMVTSLQGQTLSLRLETHLLCRADTVSCQLTFKALTQLRNGRKTSHADVLEDTVAADQVEDPCHVCTVLCTHPGYSKPLSPPCSSETPRG